MNIHFICRGNVLRSLIAETYLKSLNLKDINVISSGTNVNWNDPNEKEYFSNTLALLARHHISAYAKDMPEQLTQARTDDQHVTICMNQRVIDEAAHLVTFPTRALNWNVVDIGEGHRIDQTEREIYEEEIYKEITNHIDALVAHIR